MGEKTMRLTRGAGASQQAPKPTRSPGQKPMRAPVQKPSGGRAEKQMRTPALDESSWLPTSAKEVKERGWEAVDVIIFSGDAYVDHPSFGMAVIGRTIEALGLRVAIVPQPNWRDDLRDFKKLGIPTLFFAISAGSMDSMVNHYTAGRRLRSDDAYTAGGESGARPDMPTIVYSKILKELYPETPVVIGGIEASLRRFTHYDYWEDRLRPTILKESGADMLIYGMGERPITELCRMLQKGIPFASITNIPQTAVIRKSGERYAVDKKCREIILASHEECIADPKKQASNFRIIEEESNRMEGARLIQQVGDELVIVNPQYPVMSTEEIDKIYDLPFTRMPHPRYKGKEIPAYKMIRHSVTLHRGCFGGCSFCTISAHQGKFITSRSEASILREVEAITNMPDFRGTISDLGGPSANMYRMGGRDIELCRKCRRPSCAHPAICPNLVCDHTPLLELYRKVEAVPGVKHCFIGSGIRYDLALHETGDKEVNAANRRYLERVITHHTSGRLKVAPEHTSERVLDIMRKPSFKLFKKLDEEFKRINKKEGLNYQIVPYFISSHPGCSDSDMAELAVETKSMNYRLAQVQDFTPTPMTLATTIYATGYHPYTLKRVECAKTTEEKRRQNSFFFWYKDELRDKVKSTLLKMGRPDLVKKLFSSPLRNI